MSTTPLLTESPDDTVISTALASLVAARQEIQKQMQVLHGVVLPVLAKTLQPGTVVAFELDDYNPDVLAPTVFLDHASHQWGSRGVFKIVGDVSLSLHTAVVDNRGWRDQTLGTQWECKALVLNGKTGEPKLERGKPVDVRLYGDVADGFLGMPEQPKSYEEAVKNFVTTFQDGVPDVEHVKAQIQARDFAQQKRINGLHALHLVPNSEKEALQEAMDGTSSHRPAPGAR